MAYKLIHTNAKWTHLKHSSLWAVYLEISWDRPRKRPNSFKIKIDIITMNKVRTAPKLYYSALLYVKEK